MWSYNECENQWLSIKKKMKLDTKFNTTLFIISTAPSLILAALVIVLFLIK
jgi:hypothetical protein